MRRETTKGLKLTHPNIVRLHDFVTANFERPFISMEFIAGQTLKDLQAMQPEGFFTWDYLHPLVRQLCAALQHAHEEKVIHRDITPANVMVDTRGRVKLTDFGLSATLANTMSLLSAPPQRAERWPT